MGLGGLSGLILAAIVGALADRFGHWRVLFIGAILSVVLWPLPMFTSGLTAFTVAWVILNGVVSGVFAISFGVLSESATAAVRGRVMAFAFLPVNLGWLFGAAIGAAVTQGSVFNIFPTAAVLTAVGVGVLALAAAQPAPLQAAEEAPA